MFVIYRVHVSKQGVEFERYKEVKTLDEANEFLQEHLDDECGYTVMMEQ